MLRFDLGAEMSTQAKLIGFKETNLTTRDVRVKDNAVPGLAPRGSSIPAFPPKPSPSVAAGGVRRRFIRVDGRGVHYLRAGEGPPVVLLHAALSSARGMMPLLADLASDHTVFAFDHPGYGDSDPLPNRKVRVADVAAALEATLVALKMPPCPVYGTHTGGAVALELARRHPARVSGLVVDGPTMFRLQERKFYLSQEYMPPFVIKDDGSHLFSAWVKTRDTATWFPWNRRTANTRMARPLPPPAGLHDAFMERLRAGDSYRAVYGAAFIDGRAAVAALTIPASFVAAANDPLFGHLKRLPKLKANQRIVRHSADRLAHLNGVASVLRGYRVNVSAPPDAPFRPTRGAINRRYVDLSGRQVLVRSAGEFHRARPLLLLHDGRASSRVFEPLMRELARRCAVYALDLPDNGASDALTPAQPAIRDYADVVAQTVEALQISSCDIYAVGAGAVVALDLVIRQDFCKARLLLDTPDFYDASLARRLAHAWVPPLKPEWDGAHLNRLWLMLRDEYSCWPWFDNSPEATCAVDCPTEWQELHARVTDILRSLSTYHRLTRAALRYDWATALSKVNRRAATLATEVNDPRRPHIEAAAQLARLGRVANLPADVKRRARELLRLLAPR